MNPLQIARLALCMALMVAPLQAQDQFCDEIVKLAFTTIMKEKTDVDEKCRSMSRMEAFYAPPLSICEMPGCVDAIKKSLSRVPSCTVSYGKEIMNARTLVLAVAKMCENEARDGNLLIPRDDSSDGSDSTDSGSEDDDIPVCTKEELFEIEKLCDSEECQAVCGTSSIPTRDVRDSPLCSRPECKAYYKDVLLKKLPRCRHFGSMRYSIAVCDAAPETMPSYSVTTMPRVFFMVVVAITAVIMA